jgi:hypothetical protein
LRSLASLNPKDFRDLSPGNFETKFHEAKPRL